MKYRLKNGIIILTMFFLLFAGMKGFVLAADDTDNTGDTEIENPLENDGYSMVLYDTDNGLPTSEANDIAQTPDGFIWIGSYSGLIRYDGNEFVRFDSSTGISSVVCLWVDQQGRLWIGTNDKGIARYEDNTFTFWGIKDGLSSGSVRDIKEDAEGNIVFATTQGVWYIDTNDTLHDIEDDRLSSAYVFDLDADEQGNIYGLTLDNDVFMLQDLVCKYYVSAEDCELNSLNALGAICSEGEVYICSESDYIQKLDMKNGGRIASTIYTGEVSGINRMDRLSGTCIWLCGDNGMGYLDKNNTFHKLDRCLLDFSIDEMIIDYEGNFWFASSRQGVMKLSPSRFRNLSTDANLENLVINTTCLYGDDIYLGTDTGLVILDAKYNKVNNELTELLDGIRIRDIKEDSKGNLWLCTYGDNALVCYHEDGTYENYTEADGLLSNRVRTLLELSDGTIAVNTSGGVNLIQDGKISAGYSTEEGITNTECLCICEGDDGTIYVGSDGGGIYVIRNGKVSNISQNNGLDSGIILSIKNDPDSDNLWIITSNSIAIWNGETATTIHSFPYSNNYDLFFMDQDVWFLSGNGVYCVDKTELENDAITTYEFYNGELGLPGSITANSKNYLSEDGVLYVSGSSDLFTINLNRTNDLNAKVRLALPYADIDGTITLVDPASGLTIPSTAKRVTFYGYVLSYALSNPRVSYQLEGFDSEPVYTDKSNMSEVSYTNLTGGTYTFDLTVYDVDGNVVNTISVPVEKKKALLEEVWFRVVLLLAAIALLTIISSAIVNYKIRELKKKEREQKIFINQMIRVCSKAIDVKDQYTNGHSARVGKYAGLIAEKMGYSEERQEDIRNSALLHDLGKIYIPDSILCKPSKLTFEEFEIIKRHSEYGYDILKELDRYPEISLGARYHHERIDGKGYPCGLMGDQIPEIARIIAVADTFDAMNSNRPYRRTMDMELIVEELKRVAGTQLDEKYVSALIELIKEGKCESVD